MRTHGCQMNVHDSERLAGLLETAGYVDLASLPAGERPEVADVVVFNTCAVRENADNKLYGNLGQLRPAKQKNPGMQIAVGGCMAQKDRGTIVQRAPWVDVVFGTHNIGSLPALLDRAAHNKRAEVEILESLEVFPSTLPTRRDSAYSAWVSISVGCNNTCTFCIVPSLRGKEQDRRPGEILAEIEALVAQGVVEVTLLGQNVNTYGVEFGDRLAFGKLLRACGEIEGLERVRFTSPHPAAFTEDVILAMAETPNVMPSLHMPLQSGSDKVLKDMRRSYRSTKFLGIIDNVRQHIPDAAITTDIIVGFPGETEEDFQGTLDVVRESRFSSAFTFQYSIRPGTPAATMDDQVPKAVVQERFDRLIALQEEVSWAEQPRPSRAARSRCSSRRRRAARTPRPSACRAAPATTGSSTSPCPRAPRCRDPATWSPCRSPTARRTTSSPTRASRAGRMPSGALPAVTPGPRSRTPRRAPASRPSASGCRPSAGPPRRRSRPGCSSH